MGSYPRFCGFTPCCGGEPCRHLSHPGNGVAAPDLPGVTRPHRRRCDETEPWAWPRTRPTRLAPGRTLAQPAMSPRPLVGSYPTGSPLTGYPPLSPAEGRKGGSGGNLFCCGCSQDAAFAGLPPLAVSWGNPVPALCRPRNRDRESGSSSRQPVLPGDGSPIGPLRL